VVVLARHDKIVVLVTGSSSRIVSFFVKNGTNVKTMYFRSPYLKILDLVSVILDLPWFYCDACGCNSGVVLKSVFGGLKCRYFATFLPEAGNIQFL
jgi:hypothetical protein